MEKKYRIDWKRGLGITPEIMITSDNFHVSERNLLGAALASRLYGILPGSHFSMEKEIINNCLTIKSLNCFAITREGAIINIPKEVSFKKELPLNETTGDEFYVVLSVNPKGIASENENEPYIYPDYNFTLKKTSEAIEFGLPVLKIKNDAQWEIVQNYIPPSVALNAVDVLLQKYVETKNVINRVIEKYPKDAPHFFQTSMLQLELNGFTPEKSPEEWMLLMKKFCWIFYTHLENENKIEEDLSMKSFIEEPFNHNDIEKVMQLGYDCFIEIDKVFDIKPVEEVEELEEIKL
jgi:hypothetical protein